MVITNILVVWHEILLRYLALFSTVIFKPSDYVDPTTLPPAKKSPFLGISEKYLDSTETTSPLGTK